MDHTGQSAAREVGASNSQRSPGIRVELKYIPSLYQSGKWDVFEVLVNCVYNIPSFCVEVKSTLRSKEDRVVL